MGRVCHVGKGGTVEELLSRLWSGGTAVETTVSVPYSILPVLSIDTTMQSSDMSPRENMTHPEESGDARHIFSVKGNNSCWEVEVMRHIFSVTGNNSC